MGPEIKMSIEGESTMRFQKFDGKNFSQWKFRLDLLLDEKQLKCFVETDLEKLTADKEDDELTKIKREEAKCKSLLAYTINDEQLTHVMDKTTAKGMYDALINMFQRKSVTSQFILRKRLYSMKFHGGNISEYLMQFDNTVRELKLAGGKLEDLDLVISLLLTLPKSYNALVKSLESMDETKLTLQYVKGRLLDESAMLNSGTVLTQSKTEEACAMHGKTEGIICFKCGKVGHKKSQCYSKGKNKSKSNTSKRVLSANSASKDGNEGSLLCAIRDDEIDALSTECTSVNENGDNGSNNGSVVLNSRKLATACESTVTQAHALKTKSDDATNIIFVLDSGATDHMANQKKYFNDLKAIEEVNISTAKKDEKVCAKEIGNILFKTLYEGDTSTRMMQDVLYSSGLKCNLMSIRSLTKKGFKIVFEGDVAVVSFGGKTIFVAHAEGNLYKVIFQLERDAFAGFTGEDNLKSVSQDLWHYRLGHLNVFDMKKMVKAEMVEGMDKIDVNTDNKFCEPCVMGKHTRIPFKKRHVARSKRVLELIHTDICGPMSQPAHDGSLYVVTFTDDYSRASTVYTMKLRSEVLDKFKEFQQMAEAEHCVKISKLKRDNGGEYESHEFAAYCKSKGIQQLNTAPRNPEMNGVAERLNRNLQEKALSMLVAAKLDRRFWADAICTANFIRNRVPTGAYGKQFKTKTPAEIWNGKKPDLSFVRVFGSPCYNHVAKETRTKFQPKASKCIFIGYASTSTYRLWDLTKNKVVVARNVTFDEKSILNRLKEMQNSEAVIHFDLNSNPVAEDVSELNETLEHRVNLEDTDNNEDNVNSANLDGIGNIGDQILRSSMREKRQPDRYGDWDYEAHFALSAQQFVENDPQSIEEAKQRDDWPEWKKAIDSEYESLMKNDTWSLCDLPKCRKAISGKWVFKLKRKANGDIDKYKARFVARGFLQKEGFDFSETYAPVAKLSTLRILLAIAVHFNMHVHQMDVKGAFLNGDLNEEVYMLQPDGFNMGLKVCRLNKSIYGLKQASRMWNEKFNKFILRIGFKRCASDYCLYVKIENGIRCFILLYVDDMLIICDSLEKTKIIKGLLAAEFEMTDVGEADTFLGMHIEYDRQKEIIKLSQAQYLKNVLRKFGMESCRPTATPIEKGLHLSAEKGVMDSEVPYRELIGCLTYATLTTRPDLCAATNYFSRFQSCYKQEHFTHAKRILRYIQGTSDLKLIYRKDENADILVGYADSDWAGDKNDSKSTSGYVFQLFGNTVTWGTHKQNTVSQSSTEAEYAALAEAFNEAEWIKQLIGELGIEITGAITINEDNQSAIKVAQEHKRMKHIAVKFNFIRETISNGIVQLKYIPTGKQIADIMTKGLGKVQFNKLRCDLNLI